MADEFALFTLIALVSFFAGSCRKTDIAGVTPLRQIIPEGFPDPTLPIC